jgi:alpha-1,6-mannosyltransferase
MKICDLTQFYSPRGGGVKRYLHEKIAYLQKHSPGDEHVLIVPGARTELATAERSRIYSIASPLVSRSTGYRALLNLRAIDEIIEREQPDLLESADPYQLGWIAARISRRRRIPAVAFYHSDFAEAYLRRPAATLGVTFAAAAMQTAQSYTRALYNHFAVTLVPSFPLAQRLTAAGVHNVRVADLGVDTEIFRPAPDDSVMTRKAHKVPDNAILLLYVGRLAPEKNTRTLFEAFRLLTIRRPGVYHLVVVGDGQQRDDLQATQAATDAVTWLSYSADSLELARLYRAADLFVHPGIQETFGLVAIESQACGTPVVGIRGSAMDRIILHDQSCWAQENTAAALASAIEQCGAQDLHSLGATAAQEVAARYAWPHIFERLFCVYREVCARYREGAAG